MKDWDGKWWAESGMDQTDGFEGIVTSITNQVRLRVAIDSDIRLALLRAYQMGWEHGKEMGS